MLLSSFTTALVFWGNPCQPPTPRLDVQLLRLLRVLPTGWDLGEMNEAELGLWRVGFFHINF